MSQVALNLMERMRSSGIKFCALADALGIHRAVLSSYLHGTRPFPEGLLRPAQAWLRQRGIRMTLAALRASLPRVRDQ